jgi:dTDP-4-dehydrorhamnose reductase
MKILVLGASGMLGNAMVSTLAENPKLEVYGTLRSGLMKRFFKPEIAECLVDGIDIENNEALLKVFERIRPDVVINCIGLIKQSADHDDPLMAIPMNALLPHRLARLCGVAKARLVHISTDCVFSGTKGNYTEADPSDAGDLYGRSKFLGEVSYRHAITLRTSIIGRELESAHGLIGWFLAQQGQCKGFRRAIFSGLPTVELARVIDKLVIPRPDLSGVYHVASLPISKYDLLNLVAEVYRKPIKIVPDDNLVIDRSLNADRFRAATGYVAPEWPELVRLMHSYQ